MQYKIDLPTLLSHLDPTLCTYAEWLSVGMALHHEGAPCQAWEDWSTRDAARYRPGECQRKWRGFGHGGGSPVTGGTLVELCRRQGWEPPVPGHALGWEDTIRDDLVVVDAAWVEARELREPAAWEPRREIIRYLEALFDSTDRVSYVTEVWEKDGAYMPTKGHADRTAGELIQALNRCEDITDVIGTVKPEVGAWIRFNPVDGQDVRNDNVTAFNYALVESDSQDIERQYALMTELQLPIRVLVHSGGKSLHAIVRVEAGSYEEYRRRVDYLYTVCRKNGLDIDTQNRNPSRLSRLPGVTRKGRKQYIVAENLGKPSFAAWQEWVERGAEGGVLAPTNESQRLDEPDDLPDFEPLADFYDHLPPLSDALIAGLLRQGHKMLIAGPSKAGKSFALIQLTVALAEGWPWMGLPCAKGRVLYVNLELDRASCLHRFRAVYDALGRAPLGLGNIDIWNLRGHSLPMDKLAPKLIRRASKRSYIAVIIDPIYKIITGDENSAEQMSQFCNQFDKVCTALGTAVIYCHHHSKGAQGGKRSMDRASGSGVFARDPDAMLDMIQLSLTDAVRRHLRDRAALAAMAEVLDRALPDWRETIPQDDQCARLRLEMAAGKLLSPTAYEAMLSAVRRAEAAADQRSAWRIEATLREFPGFAPIDCWFDYPTHRVDDSGILADLAAEEAMAGWQRGARHGAEARKRQAATRREDGAAKFAEAVSAAGMGQPPTVKELAEYLNTPERTVRDQVKRYGYIIDKRTKLVVKDGVDPAQ